MSHHEQAPTSNWTSPWPYHTCGPTSLRMPHIKTASCCLSIANSGSDRSSVRACSLLRVSADSDWEIWNLSTVNLKATQERHIICTVICGRIQRQQWERDPRTLWGLSSSIRPRLDQQMLEEWRVCWGVGQERGRGGLFGGVETLWSLDHMHKQLCDWELLAHPRSQTTSTLKTAPHNKDCHMCTNLNCWSFFRKNPTWVCILVFIPFQHKKNKLQVHIPFVTSQRANR